MKDNERLNRLIDVLKTKKKDMWKLVAEELDRPRRARVQVNISKLDLCFKDGSTLLVPGKVLGSGNTKKNLHVAAFSYSGSAKKLIESSGGKAISIEELLKSNEDGKNVIIIR
jgi:large subunit ribosomal protein L18e